MPCLRSLLCAALCLVLSACQPTAKPPLRIAMNPWPGYEFLYLAEKMGYFKDHGVEVKLLELASLNDARTSFERGLADGFTGTLIEVLTARQMSHHKPRIVLVVDYSNGGDVIIAGKPINSITDLRAQRIGIEPGTLNQYILQRALENHSMTLDDVKLVGMTQEAMPKALLNQEIDAAVTYPPYSVEALQPNQHHILFSSRDIPGEVLDVLVFSAKAIAERPNDIIAVKNAFADAQDFARREPTLAYQYMAAREHISPAEFARILTEDIRLVSRNEQNLFFPPGNKLRDSLQRTQAALRISGDLESSLSVDELIAAPLAEPSP